MDTWKEVWLDSCKEIIDFWEEAWEVWLDFKSFLCWDNLFFLLAIIAGGSQHPIVQKEVAMSFYRIKRAKEGKRPCFEIELWFRPWKRLSQKSL